jgi:NADPH:quinone reductase-like Zn-dependent oxidoreductase
MKAVVLRGYGGHDAYRLEEADGPAAGPGEVLVEVHAASINPFDTKIRAGYLARFFPLALPHIPGIDYAGTVAGIGSGVSGFSVGDRVWGMADSRRPGTFAEYVAVEARLVRPMPKSLDFLQAAAVPLAGVTAWMAVDLGGVSAGQSVLVHGGAGGVGGYAIQIAKHLGAHVASTCSTANLDYVLSLGADRAIDYTREDFAAVLKDVDVAIDPFAGEVNLRTYPVMRRGGTIVVVLRGNQIEMENRDRLAAQYGVHPKLVEFDNEPAILDRLSAAIEAGAIRPTLQTVLPLADIAEASARIDTGHNRGKLVLQVRA